MIEFNKEREIRKYKILQHIPKQDYYKVYDLLSYIERIGYFSIPDNKYYIEAIIDLNKRDEKISFEEYKKYVIDYLYSIQQYQFKVFKCNRLSVDSENNIYRNILPISCYENRNYDKIHIAVNLDFENLELPEYFLKMKKEPKKEIEND